MNSSPSSSALSSPTHRPYLLRKLHSLTGTIPVGGYLLLHLWTNAHALAGRPSFDRAVDSIHELPFLLWLEIFGIYLPLLFHALYGIKLSFEGHPNVGAYPFGKNWAYVMQRVTGLIAFVFIVVHVWQFRVQVFAGHLDRVDFYPELCAKLSATVAGGIPAAALFYLVGVAASAFHFANGLAGFCFSWGLTVSRRAHQLASVVASVIGIVVLVIGSVTVIYFATGSRLLAGNSQAALFGDADVERWANCQNIEEPVEAAHSDQ